MFYPMIYPLSKIFDAPLKKKFIMYTMKLKILEKLHYKKYFKY